MRLLSLVLLLMFAVAPVGAQQQSQSPQELAAARAEVEARVRGIEAALRSITAEQQSVYQQFQNGRRKCAATSFRRRATPPETYTPPSPPPNYDDLVRDKGARESRLQTYTLEMDRLYARYRELGDRRAIAPRAAWGTDGASSMKDCAGAFASGSGLASPTGSARQRWRCCPTRVSPREMQRAADESAAVVLVPAATQRRHKVPRTTSPAVCVRDPDTRRGARCDPASARVRRGCRPVRPRATSGRWGWRPSPAPWRSRATR